MTPGLQHEDIYREAGLEGEWNFLEGQTLSRGIPSPGRWSMKEKAIISLEKGKVPDGKHTFLRKDRCAVYSHVNSNVTFCSPSCHAQAAVNQN